MRRAAPAGEASHFLPAPDTGPKAGLRLRGRRRRCKDGFHFHTPEAERPEHVFQQQLQAVGGVTGGCLLIRRDCFADVDGIRWE